MAKRPLSDQEVNATPATPALVCPYCQAHTLPGDIYCAQCGNTLVECDEFGFEVFSS